MTKRSLSTARKYSLQKVSGRETAIRRKTGAVLFKLSIVEKSINEPSQERAGLTLRAVAIAIGLTLFLLVSSSYVAVTLGVLPWPIIFSVIVSGGVLKMMNRGKSVNVHEVNVAQAGASIGGLVAGGIVFTVPGILYLNANEGLSISWPNPWTLALLTAVAGFLGVLLSVPLKKTFVDEEKLPYPAGMAGAELLKLGAVGGKFLFGVVIIGALAGIFALVRDVHFSASWSIPALMTYGVALSVRITLLPLTSGFILGAKPSFSWFGGAVIGWLILIPALFHSGYAFDDAKSLTQNFGMGMVLGSGIGFFLAYVAPRFKQIFQPFFQRSESLAKLFPILSIAAFLTLIFIDVPVFAALLCVVMVWIMVAVAARMTGETNINPLEQFGIFTGLVIAFLYAVFQLDLSYAASFTIVIFVSVACAVAGDVGHDYKSAAIVGTRFRDIVKVDLIAVVCAGVAAPFVLELIRTGFQDVLFTDAMPAPQAQLVAASIFGFHYPSAFLTGFGAACAYELVNAFLPQKYRQPVLLMPAGIGMFLGMGFAIPLALGAIIYLFIKRKFSNIEHTGIVIAAGVMGGEGLAGFLTGAFKTAGADFQQSAYWLIGLFLIAALGSVFKFWRYSKRE